MKARWPIYSRGETPYLMKKALRAEALAADAPLEQWGALALKSRTLALVVARHPAAPPALLEQMALEKMASGTGRGLLRTLAANPNTPLPMLLRLGEPFPEELLKNPAFTLALLENP